MAVITARKLFGRVETEGLSTVDSTTGEAIWYNINKA